MKRRSDKGRVTRTINFLETELEVDPNKNALCDALLKLEQAMTEPEEEVDD